MNFVNFHYLLSHSNCRLKCSSIHKITLLNNSSCKNYQLLSLLSVPLKFYSHNFFSLLTIVILSFYYFFGATILGEKITRNDLHRGYAQQQCMSTLRSMKAVVFAEATGSGSHSFPSNGAFSALNRCILIITS